MGTLYIALDLFSPQPFRDAGDSPEADEYGADAENVWAIVQPAIAVDGGEEAISLKDYFKLTAATFATSGHKIVFLDGGDPTLVPPRPSNIPPPDIRMIPVPLLPDTDLEILFAGHAIDRRTLKLERNTGDPDDPLLLPVSEWPEFAMSAYSPPRIEAFLDLAALGTEAQKLAEQEIMAWAISLIPHILQLAANPPQGGLKQLEQAAIQLFSVLNTEIQRRKNDKLAPPTQQYFETNLREIDIQSGKMRLAALWDEFQKPEAGQEPRPVNAPRYWHNLASLTSNPRDYLHLCNPGNTHSKPEAVSMLGKLWWDFADRLKSSTGDELEEAALGRLFGFGERRRWPEARLNAAPDRFMRLYEKMPDKLRFLGVTNKATNAFSLLGLAFRLPVKAGDPPAGKSLVLKILGQASPDYREPLEKLLAALKTHVGGFGASLNFDADRPGGYFYFVPKMGEGVPVVAPNGGTAFAAPPALLDIIEPEARYTLLPKASAPRPRLSHRSPQRSGIFPSELYRVELTGNVGHRLSIKTRIAAEPLTSASAHRITLESLSHPEEAGEVALRLARLAQGLEAGTELWGAKADGTVGTWNVTGNVRDYCTNADARAFLIVEDDAHGGLKTFLDALATPGAPVGLDGDASCIVNLIFPELAANEPDAKGLFNLATAVFPVNQPPLFILKCHFTSRLSQCADRLTARFEVKLAPAQPRPQSLLEEQLWNFNKFRLRLESDKQPIVMRHEDAYTAVLRGPGATIVRPLLDADAAVPMSDTHYAPNLPPWQGAAPPDSSRTFGYYITHLFTQDHRADERVSKLEQNQAESLRYMNYLTAEVAWSLEGHIENQYSYRIRLTPQTLMLPLASDISHPAEAVAKDDAENAIVAPLVRWSIDNAKSDIQLHFPREFLVLALKGGAKEIQRPARLRAIYEPLAELVAGLKSGGEAKLLLERWLFDADAQLDPTEIRTSAIPENMRCASTHTLTLHANMSALTGLQKVRDLLKRPLTEFEDAIKKESEGAGDWLLLSIPFDATWISNGDPLPGQLRDHSDVLRLGLKLLRDDKTVVDPTIVDDPKIAQGFGLPVSDTTNERYPLLKGETFGVLRENAASELQAYLAKILPDDPIGSRLRQSFSWFHAMPDSHAPVSPVVARAMRGRKSISPNKVIDPKRPERLFGAMSDFLLIPADERPPVAEVVDLYYVPVAFRPLETHPNIKDAATTLEFAMFVSELLDDLIHGRNSTLVDIKPGTVTDAVARTKALATLVVNDTAQRMVDLLACVHNANAESNKTDQIFQKVLELVSRSFVPSGAKLDFRELFADKPSLYASSKGFGLVLFDPDTWNDRIHSVQLTKQIRPQNPELARIQIAAPDNRLDRDTFLFSSFSEMNGIRYFIDVLDDDRYDNEFQITPSTFMPARSGPGGHQHVPRSTLTIRGDVQGRTGEDLIEDRNKFDASSLQRQVEIDAVVWNYSWQYPKVKHLYLLPSRRVPATPVKMKALACGPGGGLPRDAHPRRSDVDVDFRTGTSPDLVDQFKMAIKGLLLKKEEVVLSMASTTSDDDLVATRRTDSTVIFDKEVDGWWRLDTFASEHYFVFEGDEESEGGDLPFSNDRFKIEIEVHQTRTPDEPEPKPSCEHSVPGLLGLWFNYHRKLRKGDNVQAPDPLPTLQQVEDDLRNWIGPNAETNLFTSKNVVKRTVTSLIRKSNTLFLPLAKNLVTTDPLLPGSVLAAEILDLQTDSNNRYVLRVVALDECWTALRVRVRLERNLPDANGDGLPEINPDFQMFSAFSAWSSHGRERYVRDFTAVEPGSLPEVLTQLEPINVDAARFIDALLQQPSQPLDYGDLLNPILDKTFESPPKVTRRFWHESQPQSNSIRLSGMLVQRRFDLHPRFAEVPISTSVSERIEDIPRMHLPVLTGDSAGRAFSNVVPKQVRSLHHDAELMWTSGNNEVLLECRWPIRFRT